jgi:hypothetical protein
MQSCRSLVVRFWLAAAAHTDPTKAAIEIGGDAAMAPSVHPFFRFSMSLIAAIEIGGDAAMEAVFPGVEHRECM